VGQLLNGLPKAWGWGSGENLILLATLLWAGETILAKRLLPSLPAVLPASARMVGGAIVMWLYLLMTNRASGVMTLSATQWGWVVATSMLLLGYVTTWYAALKRAPATIVTSILTIGAVITAGLNLAEGNAPVAGHWIGLLMMIAGVALVLRVSKIKARQDAWLTA
jgi:drug/metabolite transporter (DMT)-like permease